MANNGHMATLDPALVVCLGLVLIWPDRCHLGLPSGVHLANMAHLAINDTNMANVHQYGHSRIISD